jgi:uncharacterized membrane protein YraQ (UPF0718 family)
LSFWLFAAFALISASLCYLLLGAEVFGSILAEDIEQVVRVLPRVAAAQIVAGFVWVLLPRDRYLELLGRDRKRGLLLATAAGIITPGGPASAFALLAVMAGAGVDRGVLIAYITSWALLAVQRIVVWDLPFMGADFSLTRFVVCLPLPVLAGLIARRLPLELALKTPPSTGPGR